MTYNIFFSEVHLTAAQDLFEQLEDKFREVIK